MPASAGEVIQRLYAAAPPGGPLPVPGPPVSAASVGAPLRDAWRDGVRLSMPDGGRGRTPEAFVRVVSEDSSARVVGEIRPSRWVQATMALYVVLLVGSAVMSSRPLLLVPLVLVVGAVGQTLMLREVRADRAALRAWLTKTVTGTR